MINGWKIIELPQGFNFRFEALRNNYGDKFYTREAAERFARENP